ncbi:MAG: 16S rRNA processing protein RimM [Chloroflexi bacterium]|nr:16S rRNA processing protein RimM [Chloroflexota bacterium]
MRGAHGLKGDVRVEPLSDRFEERFRVGSRLLSAVGPVTVAAVRGTDADPIVHFEGIDDREAAERLRGELRVSREEARAGEGHLWADLVGKAVVTPDGARLGVVREVLRAGGADVLVVQGEREILLPMLESVIREIGADAIVAVPQEEA